jgi:chromosome partitioning protein
MTQIISIANHKGGVGKTTTVINLGVALAQMEHKVLLVDLDPQGSLSAGLGIRPGESHYTSYDLLMDETLAVNQAISPIRTYLDLIPADNDLAAAEIELIPEVRRELILRQALDTIDGWYEYIIIDCPPSLSLLTVNAFSASTGIIVPMQCEFFSIRAVRMLVDTINRTRGRLNPDLELLGILATMYSTGTIHSREVLDEVRSIYGDKVFDIIIYKSIRFAEANVANKSLVEYSGQHKGAQAYRALAEKIVNRTKPDGLVA